MVQWQGCELSNDGDVAVTQIALILWALRTEEGSIITARQPTHCKLWVQSSADCAGHQTRRGHSATITVLLLFVLTSIRTVSELELIYTIQ